MSWLLGKECIIKAETGGKVSLYLVYLDKYLTMWEKVALIFWLASSENLTNFWKFIKTDLKFEYLYLKRHFSLICMCLHTESFFMQKIPFSALKAKCIHWMKKIKQLADLKISKFEQLFWGSQCLFLSVWQVFVKMYQTQWIDANCLSSK